MFWGECHRAEQRVGTHRARPLLSFNALAFVMVHLLGAGALLVRFSWRLALLGAALYAVRMFAITAGYHRYFSHRAYRLGRVSQGLMAFLAQTSGQKGVLWWAAHRHADAEGDVHSPLTNGFWWSHAGWVLSGAWVGYDPSGIQDFGRYPELRWLDRHHWVCPWFLAFVTAGLGAWWGLGGWQAFLWFCLSTVLLWHATFCINSLAHVWGTRRFETRDGSRNNALLALLTFGEGWHNNHHHCQSACRQGLRWWELDLTYAVLKALSWAGLVRDPRPYRL